MRYHRAMQAITIEHLHVKPGKLTVRVSVLPEARRTDERIARRVAADFPNVPQHSCVNGHGPAFASVITRTSMPHLLEHLIIDEQVANEPANSRTTFVGHTEWTDEATGRAIITVSFRSDTAALRAVEYATGYLNDVLKEVLGNGSSTQLLRHD